MQFNIRVFFNFYSAIYRRVRQHETEWKMAMLIPAETMRHRL